MKLIDKIKNYFCDEEEEENAKKDVPVKTEQHTFKTRVEEEEKKPEKEPNLDAISERELFKSDPTFNFPIIFDDEDFKEEKFNTKRITTVKKEQTMVVESVEPRVFKPSPNISPVYGILNSDETSASSKVSTTNDNLLNLYEENKKVNIDDILGKVYDQSRVEINRDNYQKAKEEAPFDLFKNIEVTTKEEVKTEVEVIKQPIETVDEKLKSIDELLENTDEDDFYSLVDSMYKEDEGESDK